MTEQEAEAFAKRLERIWVSVPEGEVAWRFRANVFNCRIWVAPRVRFLIESWAWILTRFDENEGAIGAMSYAIDTALIHYPRREDMPDRYETFKQFTDEWLPYFRRSCWLSGCAIEASAHEKAEWMRGFAQEKIESWNLKF